MLALIAWVVAVWVFSARWPGPPAPDPIIGGELGCVLVIAKDNPLAAVLRAGSRVTLMVPKPEAPASSASKEATPPGRETPPSTTVPAAPAVTTISPAAGAVPAGHRTVRNVRVIATTCPGEAGCQAVLAVPETEMEAIALAGQRTWVWLQPEGKSGGER